MSDIVPPRKPAILFVDDEESLLAGLSVALRRQRNIWDMQFVCGGQTAIELLQPGRFDAVVSDMQMPGVTGEKLLTAARERCPATVRILLSGQTQYEVLLRSVRFAHRYLSKPCSAADLRACLELLLGQAFSMNPATRELVCGIDQLSITPATQASLKALLDSPRVDFAALAAAIEVNAPLAAKVLHVSNAGFCAPPQLVSSVLQALTVLGMDTVRSIILSMQVREETPLSKQSARHALDTGRLLARMRGEEGALVCGVLHGLGVQVMAERLGEPYVKFLERIQADPTLSLEAAEQETFGIGNARVAAHLLGLWGVMPQITDAIRQYSAPAVTENTSELALDLRCACALTGGSATPISSPRIEANLPQWKAWADEIRALP